MNWKLVVAIVFAVLLLLFLIFTLKGQTGPRPADIVEKNNEAVGGASRSPTADEIVARYLKELGGVENLRVWKGMKGNGKFVFPEPGAADVPVTFWFKPPNKQRMEIIVKGQKAVYATDGATPWSCDPAQGVPAPTPLPEEQAREANRNDDEYPFIDYQKKGHRIDLLGNEEFEGRPVYRISLVRKNGSESTHFFDAENFREVRYLTPLKRGGVEILQEAIERDFRRVSWLLMPFEVEIKINGRTVRKLTLEKIEVDPELDDGLFKLPKTSEPRMEDYRTADVGFAQRGGPVDFLRGGSVKEESMNSRSSLQNEDAEQAAMKKLDFVIGKWKGEGWLLAGPNQRYAFSVTELYAYRCNGRVLDGEGRFQPHGVEEGPEAPTTFGLGMIYYNRPSGEYRIWHYGGTTSGFVFTNRVEVDVGRKGLHYINKDAKGQTYQFGFIVGEDDILTARSERQRPDGTWYVSMEFRMRRTK